ncbi:MAG: alpha-amylase family glycosyl hydrolase [Fimbriimonadaceae bacterium]|nr:alpha-amylase family glycosyl hydrolase [Fimbriimonadaceae bacterium]
MISAVLLLSTAVGQTPFAARDADWRFGPVVYHAFVDRFAPSDRMAAKRDRYVAPRRLRTWDDVPVGGRLDPDLGLWTHELDFWGGDLESLRTNLDHVSRLQADVLYLNPIFEAKTNHKYDARNFFRIDPDYGDDADFDRLISDLRGRKMRLVLDGVFNHCGIDNPWVQEALRDPKSPKRSWFDIGPEFPQGLRTWARTGRLAEFNLEAPGARQALWEGPDSVVAHWLRRGADGWRLDVAQDLGFKYTAQITQAAHRHKPGSLVVGEVWAHPTRWTESMDGVLSMALGEMTVSLAKGIMSPRAMATAIQDIHDKGGIDAMLKSWYVLANHDTDRLATRLPKPAERSLARALQFTLPGAPLVYYGDEIGMEGGFDPQQRGPRRWDWVKAGRPDLEETLRLTQARRDHRALRIGDLRILPAERLLVFLRTTDRPDETVLVAVNPGEVTVDETLPHMTPTILGYTLFKDIHTGAETRSLAGTVRLEIPPKTARIFRLDPERQRHDQYRRISEPAAG